MIILYTVLCFLLCFLSLVLGLAPGVTLEDSGEFATAVAGFGLPHPPGYPIYTLLAGFFVRLFSFLGSPVYLTNLFSALTTALAASFLFLFFHKLLTLCEFRNLNPWIRGGLSAAASLFVCHTPIYFRQSVITEVYGLYDLLTAIYLYCYLQAFSTDEEKVHPRQIYFLCFLNCMMGLSHTLSIVFVPMTAYLVLRNIRQIEKPVRHLGLSMFFCFLGLLPLLYLPLAGLHQPVLYWGEPSTWADFLRVILREQYGPKLDRPWILFVEQLRENVVILLEQASFVMVFLGILGLVWIHSIQRRIFYFLLAGLLLTGPVVAFLTNFKIPSSDLYYTDVSALLTVFYLNHLVFWSALLLIFSGFVLHKVSFRIQATVLTLLVLGLGIWAAQTHRLESKRGYTFAETLYENIGLLTGGKPALILTNWDPFTFPGFYYQLIEGKYKNLKIVDLEMLKAPWYVRHLDKTYPDLFSSLDFEKDRFLRMSEHLMNHSPQLVLSEYWDRHRRLIAAVIRKSLNKKNPVFVMIARDMNKLPLGVGEGMEFIDLPLGAQLVEPGSQPTEIPNCTEFRWDSFQLPQNSTHQQDRMAQMQARFYSSSLQNWIRRLEELKKPEEARACQAILENLKEFSNSAQN